MSWGTLTIGRTSLRETYTADHKVNMNTGLTTVSLAGVEWAAGAITAGHVRARREALMSLSIGSVVPVIFSMKTDHTGFYRVVDSGVTHTDWDEADHFTWSLALERVGVPTASDIESRLTGVARLNDHGPLPGELWHAPSVGATGYYVGAAAPATVNRTTPEGVVTVYRAIPAATDPRWAATPQAYAGGRARVLIDAIERDGIGFKTGGSWEINNGLVRVTPLSSGGLLQISAYDGTQWETKNWNVSVGSAITSFDEMTVLRNDYEAVTIRLYKAQAPSGRIYVDLSIRRGSRFVEGYIQAAVSATIAVTLNTPEASTGNTGYVVANANDAAGNRAIIGSAKTFTADTNGGLSKASTRLLDFFAGVVVGGGTPATGDSAVNMRDQYIGALAESTMVVKR